MSHKQHAHERRRTRRKRLTIPAPAPSTQCPPNATSPTPVLGLALFGTLGFRVRHPFPHLPFPHLPGPTSPAPTSPPPVARPPHLHHGQGPPHALSEVALATWQAPPQLQTRGHKACTARQQQSRPHPHRPKPEQPRGCQQPTVETVQCTQPKRPLPAAAASPASPSCPHLAQ